MNKYLPIAILVGIATSFSSWAINVGDITSIMTSEESSLSKEIINTTDSARYVSVTVKQLSSPLPGGVEMSLANPGELLSTPANLILPGDAKDVFRFFYKGPEDDKERYYRLQWIDEPVTKALQLKPAKPQRQRPRRRLGLSWWLPHVRSALITAVRTILSPTLAMSLSALLPMAYARILPWIRVKVAVNVTTSCQGQK